MRKHLKKYLVPHPDNNYRPHIFRSLSVIIIILFLLGVFAFSLVTLPHNHFLAAVVPDVLVDLTNQNRAENNLGELVINEKLIAAAQAKADHMAENGYFAHNSPDGKTPWYWVTQSGYQFQSSGENLAVNFTDSDQVEDAWMDSPGHRANILNGQFTEIGIATARGEYKGRQTTFVVQMFGRPSPTAFPVPVAVTQQPTEVAQAPTPTVLGEATSSPVSESVVSPDEKETPSDSPETPVRVVHEDDLFIAVEAVDTQHTETDDTQTEEATSVVAGAEAQGLLPNMQSHWWERLLSQPKNLLQLLYLFVAVVVLIALIMSCVIDFEQQHPRHLVSGILLLALALVLIYLSRSILFGSLLIV